MKTLGQKLNTLRKDANMSQEELAEQLGVSRQAISKWERDEGSPDLFNIQMIAKVFNITIDSLLNAEIETPRMKKGNGDLRNKIGIILISIFVFLSGAAIIALFIGMMIYSLPILSALIEFFRIDIHNRLSYYIFNQEILFTLIMLVYFILFSIYIMIYSNIYSTKHEFKEKHRLTLILLNGFLLSSYLSVLAFISLSGFSFIFLYIVGFLVVLSGLVGSFLIAPTQNEFKKIERTSKFKTIFKRIIVVSSIIISFISLSSLIQVTYLTKETILLTHTMMSDENPKANLEINYAPYHQSDEFLLQIEDEALSKLDEYEISIYVNEELLFHDNINISEEESYREIIIFRDENIFRLRKSFELEGIISTADSFRIEITYSEDGVEKTANIICDEDIHFGNYAEAIAIPIWYDIP